MGSEGVFAAVCHVEESVVVFVLGVDRAHRRTVEKKYGILCKL